MRVRALVVLLASTAAATGCGASATGPSTSDGEAACAAPFTTVDEPTVAPGQTVEVTAEGLWSSCRDHGASAEDGPVVYSDPEPTPLTAQVVRFTQGGTDVELAVVDTGTDASIEVDVTIPADAEPGPAEIAVGRADPAAVTVGPGAASPRTSG
ncbi:hypothetical protein [Jiangella mangrovi]|uniref:Uncharacterized protein n=1 Tax=Jiangella mangrovi TaxID=1524084 RepID=A0A7W9GXH9_9ACTN|nr:hypothetical protein [Jiangella mangrovi]MBB5791880.1 hypothetical protein [Jiangella mangrovi]